MAHQVNAGNGDVGKQLGGEHLPAAIPPCCCSRLASFFVHPSLVSSGYPVHQMNGDAGKQLGSRHIQQQFLLLLPYDVKLCFIVFRLMVLVLESSMPGLVRVVGSSGQCWQWRRRQAAG